MWNHHHNWQRTFQSHPAISLCGFVVNVFPHLGSHVTFSVTVDESVFPRISHKGKHTVCFHSAEWFLRFIHVITCIDSLFFLWLSNCRLCGSTIYCLFITCCWTFGLFLVWGCYVMTIHVEVFVFISVGIQVLKKSHASSFFSLIKSAKQFSKVILPFVLVSR